MKIVFMGTPDFAIPAFEVLLNSGHQVLAAYTREAKPFGRGKKLTKSPVHILAEKHGIQAYTPKNFKNNQDVEDLKALDADIIVVVAYGLIIPPALLKAFKYGVINIHPSKLPRWRGAAPIQRCIMAGDKETAICIMQMDEGLDTGDIILEKSYPIPENITSNQLSHLLANQGANLLLEALEKIEDGTAEWKKQSDEGITYANKISKEEGEINWDLDARSVNCMIRGLSPRPGAYFVYNNERIKIITAEYDLKEVNYSPGTVIDGHLTIACGKGTIKPTLVQRRGREMVYTEAFLRGFSVHIGANIKPKS